MVWRKEQACHKILQLVFSLLPFHALLLLGCQTLPPLDPIACKTIVILPPESIDERTSDYVIQLWIKAARDRKYFKSCDKIVSSDHAKNVFTFLNISHADPVEASELSANMRSVFQVQFKGTHAVSLDYSYNFGKLTIKPLVLNIISNKPDRGLLHKHVVMREAESEYFEIPFSRWLKLSLAQLVPTSVVGGFSEQDFENEYASGGDDDIYHELSSENASSIPPVLSSFRFEKILHRKGFNLFDVSFRFVPYFNFRFTNQLNTYAPKSEWDAHQTDPTIPFTSFDYNLKFYASVLNILGDLAFYTPIGSLFFSLGPGLGIYHYEDSLNENYTGPMLSLLTRIGYRAFFNDRWYFQFIAENQSYNGAIENESFKSSSDSYAILGIGFFYPEIQRAATRSLLE